MIRNRDEKVDTHELNNLLQRSISKNSFVEVDSETLTSIIAEVKDSRTKLEKIALIHPEVNLNVDA